MNVNFKEFSLPILLILFGVIIFLLIRELVCWYFKINKQVRLQQLMLETLLKIYEQNGGEVNWDACKKELTRK